MSWKEKVTYIKQFDEKGIYLFIDESGFSNNKHLKKVNECCYDDNKYPENSEEAFSLTGVLISGRELKKARSFFVALKRKWFGNEYVEFNNAKLEIVLHRTDFGNKNPFKSSNKFCKKIFENEIEGQLSKVDFKVFSSCINKSIALQNDLLDLTKDNAIYNKAISDIIKTIKRDTDLSKNKLILVFESRSDKDNKSILSYILQKRDNNVNSIIKSVYFSSKRINGRAVTGLEIADYFSFSSFRWTLCREYHRVAQNYNRFPLHYDNGLKILI